ncbi:MAG: glycoside hydrolase family 71/99-like protein [Verrucomicrobiales bacterium]|nr:glycoside hydrolase family 71/99-like protein [Verrucomicrobiales bacterium]MED5586736.1 glycoside hydrolase family 71/99-like protein [Verrucomicrobiota bacterium]
MRITTFIKTAFLFCLLSSGGQLPLGAEPLASSAKKDSGQQALKDQKILVHYMPWYASKSFSGEWGWHWTMNHFDPDKKGREGKRLLASHYRPLIGPYDSNDPDVLECQVLLMKLSGIDGVIVDWYGKNDFNDYAAIHRNAVHLVQYLKRAGLNFAVCYEDRTVGQMIKGGALKAEDAVLHGRDTLRWLQANWFNREAYLKINKKPIMMVFGPMHYSRQQWQGIFDGLDHPPLLFSLPHLSQKAGADGIFGWVPVHAGKKMSPAQWRGYLDGIYNRGKRGEQVIATVFPGFHDIYQEAGLHQSYGFIDDNGGVTFKETLEIALRSESRFIQVATWNDYGEGTMIEPTVSFGYRYLEVLQECALKRQGKEFVFAPDDLRLPVKLYNLRKRFKGDGQALEELKRVSGLLFSSRCEEAAALLQKVADSHEGKRLRL